MAAARSILHRFTLPERPNQTELPLPGPPSSDLTSAAARLDSRAAHDCFEETQVPPASVPDPAQLMASLARSVGAPHGRINAAVGFGCAGFNSRLAALPFRGMPTPPAAWARVSVTIRSRPRHRRRRPLTGRPALAHLSWVAAAPSACVRVRPPIRSVDGNSNTPGPPHPRALDSSPAAGAAPTV